MKNMKLKRTLLMLTLLVMTLSAVTGGTIAWFTDSVASDVNQIQAGNLDLEMNYWNGTEYADTEGTVILDDSALWEPGYTEVVYLELKNAGSLALQYKLTTEVSEEIAGTNVAGQTFKLSDFIKFKVAELADADSRFASRQEARAIAGEEFNLNNYTSSDALLPLDPNDVKYIALVIYMPENVGNEANAKTGTVAPSIKLSLNAQATQYSHERDAFDATYDQNASYSENSVTVPVYPAATDVELISADSVVHVFVPAAAIQSGNKFLTLNAVKDNEKSGTNLLGVQSLVYDISVDGIKSGNTEAITVSIQGEKNAKKVTVKHNGEVIDSANMTYDVNTGIVTFTTTSFSTFEVTMDSREIIDATDIDTWAELCTLLKTGAVKNGGVYDFGGNEIIMESSPAAELAWNVRDITLMNLTLVNKVSGWSATGGSLTSGMGYTLRMENCVIDSKCKLYVQTSASIAQVYMNCTFKNNINIDNVNNAIFEGCTFTNSSPMTFGGNCKNLTVRNCHFSANSPSVRVSKYAAGLENIVFENNTYAKNALKASVDTDAKTLYQEALDSGNFIIR